MNPSPTKRLRSNINSNILEETEIPSKADIIKMKLDDAFRHLNGGTNNQNGMPQYLRGVAAEFGKIKDMIEEIENNTYKQAITWQKSLNGNSNNSNIEGGRRIKNRTKKNRSNK